MSSNALMPIEAQDRVFITGKTGTGKTTIAKVLLRRVQRFVALDPKQLLEMRGVPILADYDPKKNRQIIRIGRGVDAIAAWDEIVGRIYDDGDIIIYIDELTALTRPDRLPTHLDWAISTGRQHNVGVWMATQRPKQVPSKVFTEAEHYLIFRLAWEDDRKKMVQMTNSEIETPLTTLRGHDFVYYNERADAPNDWFIVREGRVPVNNGRGREGGVLLPA